MQAVYQPQGGILASESCIAAHIQAAQSHGADFHSGEKVESWKVNPSTGIVTVFTDKGQHTAGKLVLTAGSWMPDIMPELQVTLPSCCSDAIHLSQDPCACVLGKHDSYCLALAHSHSACATSALCSFVYTMLPIKCLSGSALTLSGIFAVAGAALLTKKCVGLSVYVCVQASTQLLLVFLLLPFHAATVSNRALT